MWFSSKLRLRHLIVAITVIGAGGAAYFLYAHINGIPGIDIRMESSSEATDTTPATQEISQGERSYQNQMFHFAVAYPDNLQATEYKERGGAMTVTFEDPTTNGGFEVYVTPYSGTQISGARFKLDEPSGTFQNPTNVVINGVTATKFYGYNPIMGDTCEVWFIHNGLLYEITTYKSLEDSLSQIMTTWKFVE